VVCGVVAVLAVVMVVGFVRVGVGAGFLEFGSEGAGSKRVLGVY